VIAHTVQAPTRRRSVHAEDGAVVIVLVAMLLVVFVIFTALVIDIGNGRQVRRTAQNQVDAAALAATAVYDGAAATRTAARSEALRYLAVNGLRINTTATTSNSYPCIAPDSCQVTFAFPNDGLRCIEVRLTDFSVTTFFAGVIGVDQLRVGATAIGCNRRASTRLSDFPAAGAHGICENPFEAFETSGNNNRFDGNIESREGAQDTGGDNTRTGTAVTREVPKTVGNLWMDYTLAARATGPDPLSAALGQTPLQIINSYKPGGSRATAAQALGLYNNNSPGGGAPNIATSGELKLTSPLYAGIYYTSGKITADVDGLTVTPRIIGGVTYTGVTLVTDGDQVVLGKNGSRLTPFNFQNPLRITIVAGWDSPGNPCSDTGLVLGGECVRVNGIMYVPFMKATFSNNGNGHDDNGLTSTNCANTPGYRGALLAYSLKLDGNRHVLRGSPGISTSVNEIYLGS
jgi:hypothetical protein